MESWSLGPGELDVDRLRRALPGHSIDMLERTLVHKAPTESDLDAGSIIIAGHLSSAGIAIRGVRRGHTLEDSYLQRTQPVVGLENDSS